MAASVCNYSALRCCLEITETDEFRHHLATNNTVKHYFLRACNFRELVALCVCFHWNTAAEYSSVGNTSPGSC